MMRCRDSTLLSSLSSWTESMMYAISTGPVLNAMPTSVRAAMSVGTEKAKDIKQLQKPWAATPVSKTPLRPMRSARLPTAGEQNICAML